MESYETKGPPSPSFLINNLSFPLFHEGLIRFTSKHTFGSLSLLVEYPIRRAYHTRLFLSQNSPRDESAKIHRLLFGPFMPLSHEMVEPYLFSPAEPVNSYGLRLDTRQYR